MKYLLLFIVLFIVGAMTPASSASITHDIGEKETAIVAKRLASKNLTEIVVIAMKLQIECQQRNNKDVCDGVRNILAVLDSRVASLPKANEDESIAFLKGLMEGVDEANQEVIANINGPL